MTEKLFIICLIQSVEKHPCIWNSRTVVYAKRNKLEKAWQQISQECGEPVNYCKEKWKNVRTGFLRSLREYPENSSPAIMAKRKPFYLYEHMRFMLPLILPSYTSSQQSVGQLPYLKTEGGSNDNELDLLAEFEELDSFDNFEFTQKEGYFTHFGPCRLGSPQPQCGLASSDPPKKKYRVACDENREKVASPEELALMSFFRGIASDVLSLSMRKQRLFKRKLVELVDNLHAECKDK